MNIIKHDAFISTVFNLKIKLHCLIYVAIDIFVYLNTYQYNSVFGLQWAYQTHPVTAMYHWHIGWRLWGLHFHTLSHTHMLFHRWTHCTTGCIHLSSWEETHIYQLEKINHVEIRNKTWKNVIVYHNINFDWLYS